MTLQLLPAPEDREPQRELGHVLSLEGRSLAPGAPKSPGPVPLELATELRVGEAVIWWGSKDELDRRPIVWMLIAGFSMLALATLLAPELWAQPWTELWKPLLPAVAPAALLAVREWLSLRTVVVTDNSVVVCDMRGRVERLGFRNIRRVSRDFVTGGVLLEGTAHKVRIPPVLAEDTRTAIGTQTRHTLQGGDGPIDPLRWLP